MNKTITLGGGCFWCTEAVYDLIEGVKSVTSGYIDGHVDNPTYREVCTGTTGHNEVIQVIFDDDIVSLKDIIDIFWTAHDPTTLNRQGADKGTQYRSGIYFENDEDEAVILASKEAGQNLWDDPIVTEVKKATTFYPAEKYHHDYYERNSHVGYCRVVINPKLAKVRAAFADKLKK